MSEDCNIDIFQYIKDKYKINGDSVNAFRRGDKQEKSSPVFVLFAWIITRNEILYKHTNLKGKIYL